MKHFTEFFELISEKCSFPEDAVKVFNEVAKRLDDEKEFGAKFDRIRRDFMYPVAHNIGRAHDRIVDLAKEYKVNEYTLLFVFLMECSELLLKRYKARGLSEELYWAGMDDLRCKLLECIECEGVPGTFVMTWNEGFYALGRFALGRFQYEGHRRFPCDFTTSSGYKIKKGTKCVNFHIPSSGIPLTDEVRLDSYKKAYAFYKDHINKDGNIIFICSSWLLYPRHKEFFPENLNILKFANDFEIFKWEESDHFGNDWRVFGHYTDFPLEEWPEDTSLRKAYKHWLLEGNPAGHGEGVIVFDGEKILK